MAISYLDNHAGSEPTTGDRLRQASRRPRGDRHHRARIGTGALILTPAASDVRYSGRRFTLLQDLLPQVAFVCFQTSIENH
jgi:hypothetical protein